LSTPRGVEGLVAVSWTPQRFPVMARLDRVGVPSEVEGESSTRMLEEVNDGGGSKTVVKLSDAELLELGGGADQDQS
jgi:hypothetical protein